jgi:hypothetical protein
VSRLHESLPALFRISWLQIFGTSITSFAVCLSLTALGTLGCAPRGGTATRDDVVEIETIEVAAPPPAAEPAVEPAVDSSAAARQAIDEEKAAADKAIDEAGKSIEPPAEEPTPADAPAPADL